MQKFVMTMLILTLFFIASPGHAAEATKESVQKLMQNSGAGEMGVGIVDEMLPELKKMLQGAPDSFWEDIRAEINPEDLVNLVVPIYQKYLTEEEVQAINDFYNSPAGKKLVGVQASIMEESFQAGQQWGQEIVQKVINKYREEVEGQ